MGVGVILGVEGSIEIKESRKERKETLTCQIDNSAVFRTFVACIPHCHWRDDICQEFVRNSEQVLFFKGLQIDLIVNLR